MNNITFATNPIDKSSKLRGDLDWQNKSLKSEKSKFMIFLEDKPLIYIDPKNVGEPKIFWTAYQEVKDLFTFKTLTLFLGVIEENIYYALDIDLSLIHI